MKMQRTVFSNTYDAPFNPYRKFYSVIELDKKEVIEEYVGKFRSEAQAYFEELARLSHGKVKLISTFKN